MKTKCGRRIVVIFGTLLLAAVLFVPYRAKEVKVTQNGRRASFALKTTLESRGYMFLLTYLDRNGRWHSRATREEREVRLRTGILAVEIGGLLVLGTADYFLFCVWLRGRRRRNRARLGDRGSGTP